MKTTNTTNESIATGLIWIADNLWKGATANEEWQRMFGCTIQETLKNYAKILKQEVTE